MVNTELQDSLDDCFARVLQSTLIAENQDLFETGLMNSLRAMHLVLQLEKTFRFRFSAADIKRGNSRSRSAILDLLYRYVGKQGTLSSEVGACD